MMMKIMLFASSSISILVVIIIGGCTTSSSNGVVMALLSDSSSTTTSMWNVFETQQPSSPVQQAFHTIFGIKGERGEYMDGYSKQSMIERCIEDYRWSSASAAAITTTATTTTISTSTERANMMSHLYNNKDLWKYVCMVAFAEHYVLTGGVNDVVDSSSDDKAITTAKPFETFQKQKDSQPSDEPIFSGVVFSDWESSDDFRIQEKLSTFREKRIDYVRLECNFGTVDDIGMPTEFVDNLQINNRFNRLAQVSRMCQNQSLVPLVLLQMPWREKTRDYSSSMDYFVEAVKCFAGALRTAKVDPKRMIFETRPPIGMSSQQERSLSGKERISLGLETGHKMFKVIESAFEGETVAGFCVAGGSTKGDYPTAMEDDTQNAVRQGIREIAYQQWGYEFCFWEMGAKLMLQPKVGRLWGCCGNNSQSGRDAARELFRVNAKDMAIEITSGLNQIK